MEDFVSEQGQREDEVMAEHLRRFAHEEGIVFVGKAQEIVPRHFSRRLR